MIFLKYFQINIREKNIRETEGAIKNGQSRKTGYMGHTRHRTKTSKKKKQTTTQYANNVNKHGI